MDGSADGKVSEEDLLKLTDSQNPERKPWQAER